MKLKILWLTVCLYIWVGAQGQMEQITEKMSAGQLTYHTFSGRAKCSWTANEKTSEFQCSIRMVKDSIIWGSITGPMSIEAARFLITPDTFRLMSVITKEYLVKEMSYVMRWLTLPLTFAQLQQLLAGNMIQLDNGVSTFFQDSLKTTVYTENAKLQVQTSVDPVNYNITSMVLKDKMLDQQMQLTFGQPEKKQEKLFYPQRNVSIMQGREQMKLQLDFTRWVADEALSLPFDPDNSYKRVE